MEAAVISVGVIFGSAIILGLCSFISWSYEESLKAREDRQWRDFRHKQFLHGQITEDEYLEFMDSTGTYGYTGTAGGPHSPSETSEKGRLVDTLS